MKLGEYIKEASARLDRAGVGTPRLDVLVLLEDVTGRDRAWLLAHPEYALAPEHHAKLTKLLNARADHTPLAYVRGATEFYGRNFVITPSVLEPRPESETMIDLLKDLYDKGKLTPKAALSGKKGADAIKIADVGTGSGALGITAKLELAKGRKTAVDLLEVDTEAMKVAHINVEKHTTNISVIRSDLLDDSGKDYDILLCNLPYVPDSHPVNPAAAHEPRIAIFGGPDGLDVYRRLFDQTGKLEIQPLYILTEALPPQHTVLTGIARQAGYRLITTDDFIQVFAPAGP